MNYPPHFLPNSIAFSNRFTLCSVCFVFPEVFANISSTNVIVNWYSHGEVDHILERLSSSLGTLHEVTGGKKVHVLADFRFISHVSCEFSRLFRVYALDSSRLTCSHGNVVEETHHCQQKGCGRCVRPGDSYHNLRYYDGRLLQGTDNQRGC